MRVISGKYKGKKLDGFDINGTRPTQDRVKESIFAIIQNDIKGANCLDLFAGSGSLGIEAISNGANKCVFVDSQNDIFSILKRNTSQIDNCILYCEDFRSFLLRTREKFDVIFLDPPYNSFFIDEAISLIMKKKLLNSGGIIICEYYDEDFSCNLNIIKEKKYGWKNVRIYKN